MQPQSYRSSCPMCGNKPHFAADFSPVTILTERRPFALQVRLDQLHSKTFDMGKLSAHIGQMCGMCQMLMLGISSEADLPELASRIECDLAESLADRRGAA